MRALYSVVGAVVMLGFYDPMLVVFCLLLLTLATIVNSFYGQKVHYASENLHDQLEREVDIIQGQREVDVRAHYGCLAGWRVKLSDWEALNFTFMEFFVLGLMAASLLRICTASTPDVGTVFAIFRYVMIFVMGLDSIPMLVAQWNRIRDIGQRV